MAELTVLKNQQAILDLASDFVNTGWSVSGDALVHDPCNAGFIRNNAIETIPGEEYTIKFTVEGWVSGMVQAIVGGENAPAVSANGDYEHVVVADDDTGIGFYSDGDLRVTNIEVLGNLVSSVTLGFNGSNTRFTSFFSYDPEFMGKYLTRFFTFKQGETWEHHTNDDHGSFYGEQYPAVIKFLINVEPSAIKTLMSVRLVGNKPWKLDIVIPPRDGKSEGQKSRIKAKDFKKLQGQWFADFKKDMNDPRFTDELKALFSGADLQGAIAEITIENKDKTPVRLVAVDTEMSYSQYTY